MIGRGGAAALRGSEEASPDHLSCAEEHEEDPESQQRDADGVCFCQEVGGVLLQPKKEPMVAALSTGKQTESAVLPAIRG